MNILVHYNSKEFKKNIDGRLTGRDANSRLAPAGLFLTQDIEKYFHTCACTFFSAL
jgi:hypothetical protein